MRVMIVGDLGGQLSVASKIALDSGAKVSHVDSIEHMLTALRVGRGADLVMVDFKLNISELIASLDRERFSIPVIACGVESDIERATHAIHAGAREFISLPPDPEMIAAILSAIGDDNRPMIVEHPAIRAIIELADRIAPSEASVLITGESGVGKEVIARYIHKKSRRASKPFISVNCAAIPENLLESELFGHEKGAFTGALTRRIGKFEEADGGTLLLDEISEMDARLQAKLLRAIQEREIDRVGGSKTVKVDIRILATSNRDLNKAVIDGDFREDLLYRLNVVNLQIPPLRERPSDAVKLAEFFIDKYAKINGIDIKPLSICARNQIETAPWRGNVRELENTMHRAILLSTGPEIDANLITMPHPNAQQSQTASQIQHATDLAGHLSKSYVGRALADVECDLILDTLDHCLGNRTHAANILGISIRTLRNKLRQYTCEGKTVPAPGETRNIA